MIIKYTVTHNITITETRIVVDSISAHGSDTQVIDREDPVDVAAENTAMNAAIAAKNDQFKAAAITAAGA